MNYLDYAANYPACKEALDAFVQTERAYIGNANSTHLAGRRSLKRYRELNEERLKLLNLDKDEYEIIYTSSATESNNIAIKGIYGAYNAYSDYWVASPFEHSSVNACLSYLKDKGENIDLLKAESDGKISLSDLQAKRKKYPHPLLTCCLLVESETGAIQPYHEIQNIVSQSENAYLLVDATQAVGKIDVSFSGIDRVSFAPHKFGGLLGSGVLIKKKSIILTPLIHGGKSISMYRSSTPCLGLIASTVKAVELALKNREAHFKKTKETRDYLLSQLKEEERIRINSFDENPYIVNLSVEDIYGDDRVYELAKRGICVSQKSACSIPNTPSKPVRAIYHDKQRALESFRISLSSLTTKEEIDGLCYARKEIIDEN